GHLIWRTGIDPAIATEVDKHLPDITWIAKERRVQRVCPLIIKPFPVDVNMCASYHVTVRVGMRGPVNFEPYKYDDLLDAILKSYLAKANAASINVQVELFSRSVRVQLVRDVYPRK